MTDIASRLRQTRSDMIGTDDEQHYFDCHEAASEIERLRRWAQLTEPERRAVEFAIRQLLSMPIAADIEAAEVLRSMHARLITGRTA